MNSKTIRKILKSKHEEFCLSIEDEEVRKLVQKNAIITGGSIVSMLLNEKIKDFDYYFTNIETVQAVARYYAAQFKKLNPQCNREPKVIIEGERVRIKIQSAGIAGEGGDEGYKYFEQHSYEEAEEYMDKISACLDDPTLKEAEEENTNKPTYRPIFLSDNAITLSNKVQLVIRFYGTPEEIHKNYDFVHCTNYWVAKENKLVLHPEALQSILARELFYQGSLYPVCSIIRTRKFIKQGWHINAGQFLKMCFQVSELNLSDLEVLQEQLTGVDAAYFIELIEYCKKRKEETPDFEITMPYLCKIVDRIFGEPR